MATEQSVFDEANQLLKNGIEFTATVIALRALGALERVASCVEIGPHNIAHLRMRDVARADVYAQHLGQKLSGGGK